MEIVKNYKAQQCTENKYIFAVFHSGRGGLDFNKFKVQSEAIVIGHD